MRGKYQVLRCAAIRPTISTTTCQQSLLTRVKGDDDIKVDKSCHSCNVYNFDDKIYDTKQWAWVSSIYFKAFSFLCSQLGCDLFWWVPSGQVLVKKRFWRKISTILIPLFIISSITWTLGLVESDPKALSRMVSATLAILDFSSAEEPWNYNLVRSWGCSWSHPNRNKWHRKL